MFTRAIVIACCLAAVAPAHAADPGRWLVGSTVVLPSSYRQGLASDSAGNVFFSGSFAGIHRTNSAFVLKAENNSPIPPDVAQREQYNHIGDIAWDRGEGGRLLLPLESYAPFEKDTNPSHSGSIGVMDARTLRWSYYVKLDPAEIPKAQWLATSPDGLVWTISGPDLLAYNLADVTPANAAPNGPVIHSVRRFSGVLPGGAGGAVWLGGRLYVSTHGAGGDRVDSIDLTTGSPRTEVELPGSLEAEGMDLGAYGGGILHWALAPGGGLSNTTLRNLLPVGAPLRLTLSAGHVKAGKPAKVTASVVVVATGFRVPLAGVQVRIGGSSARTDARGRATLKVRLTRGGYRAQAFFKRLRTATARLRAT